MIYNGTSSNNKCETTTGDSTTIRKSIFNNTNNDNAYLGYVYGSVPSTSYAMAHANTNNSTVKTYIENWYNTNLKTYENKIVDAIFCNDRQSTSVDGGVPNNSNGYGNLQTFYGAYYRLWSNKTPSLKCTQEKDKLNLKIALINADEAKFAGAYEKNFPTSYFYLNINTYYWTISPYHYYDNMSRMWFIGPTGDNFGGSQVVNTSGIRPVINLSPAIHVTGDGSQTNPFIVK